MKKLVYIMLSGGVDSSVAAYLLKSNPSYDVRGVFMKCWSLEKLLEKGFSSDVYACNWEEDSLDAKVVAEKLNIPFEIWDFQEEYADQIVDYMINEYQIGRTPNPDVMCNSVVKFGVFYERAMELGADFVATGHYAKVINHGTYSTIHKSEDANKDQSYFLWKIPPSRLSKTLMPIGEIKNKDEVRQIAIQNSLITANKKDSQGLCFVGKSSLRLMLTQRLGVMEGEIVTEDLENARNAVRINNKQKLEFRLYKHITIGTHHGSYLYTIGQRENLKLSGGPWYVSKIDIKTNRVYVVHQSNIQTTNSISVVLEGVNTFETFDEDQSYECILRYNQIPLACKLKKSGKSIVVLFENGTNGIALGQSLVVYKNDKLIIGGVISSKS
jgi:tRNA-uridine 2-sulfurtransferase